jgi:hypothetical protein
MKRMLLAVAVLPLLANAGCQNMSNTDKGVLGGGALGAGIGALAAGPHHAGAGALIGGGVGALTGGLLGNSKDEEQKARAAAIAAHTAGPAQLQEIAGMATNHISDPVIISKIRTDGYVYHLSGEDINYLKQYGVSDPVIEVMTATAGYPRRVYREVPVQPVYVVQPAPPPPVSVGVGVGFGR